MKKFLFYFMLINVFLFGSIEVKAASSCSYDDQAKMNSAAANVKINYEAKTAEMNPNDYQVPDAYLDTDLENSTLSYYYFQINILNLTNDMYAIITNDNNSDSVRVNYSDTTNGTYYYNWTNLNYITNLKMQIFSSTATNCANQLLYTNYLTLPRINEYRDYDICTGYSDYYLCQRYVTYEPIDHQTFNDRMEDYINSLNKTETKNNTENNSSLNKISSYIKQHYAIVLLIIIGILIILILTTIIKRGKKQNEK